MKNDVFWLNMRAQKPKYLLIGKRLVKLREGRNLNQIQAAAALGIKYPTYQNYEYGFSQPNTENLKKIIDYYDCSYFWLLSEIGPPFKPVERRGLWGGELFPADDYVFIRQVNGKISAGGGLMPENSADLQCAFRRDWIKRRGGNPNNMSLIKVSGDSMEPTLLAGDLVLVDHSRIAVAPQGGIYAISINQEIMIKRIQVLFPHNKLRILSDNANYEPIEADPEQIKINGKVIWFGRDMDK